MYIALFIPCCSPLARHLLYFDWLVHYHMGPVLLFIALYWRWFPTEWSPKRCVPKYVFVNVFGSLKGILGFLLVFLLWNSRSTGIAWDFFWTFVNKFKPLIWLFFCNKSKSVWRICLENFLWYKAGMKICIEVYENHIMNTGLWISIW